MFVLFFVCVALCSEYNFSNKKLQELRASSNFANLGFYFKVAAVVSVQRRPNLVTEITSRVCVFFKILGEKTFLLCKITEKPGG